MLCLEGEAFSIEINNSRACAMLHIENLRFGYTETPILNIPKLEVPDGRHLLIQGPSGSGKSSLLSLLAGLLNPKKGRIVLNGTDIHTLPTTARDAFRGKHIGFVFQQPHLIPALTVLQNVLMAPFMAGVKTDKAHAMKLLEKLGIAKLANRYPTELSHGQQQRVGVARALVHKPDLVLADEPTSALDDKAAETTINLLLNTAKEVKAQVVVATHDARIAKKFGQTLTLKGE
jgi:putative ABC transport system ATP-binding protein